jgi:hypothetical protein
MSVVKTQSVELTPEERVLLSTALDYYLDTLDRCRVHASRFHGDERDCEGWGPRELAVLERAADKVAGRRRA